MRKQYYSQRGEDIILYNLMKHYYCTEHIFYLDIGCGDPIKHSNTYKFYENGNRGVCIDPNAIYAELWKTIRKDDIFINKAFTNSKNPANYYVFNNQLLNTTCQVQKKYLYKAFEYKPSQSITVPTINAYEVIKEFYLHYPSIDLVSVDTEGAELEILQSLLIFECFNPLVICVEEVDFVSGLPKESGIKELLSKHGYAFFVQLLLIIFFLK